MPHGRPPGFFRLRAREVDEPRTVVLAVQQSAVDHDVEELPNTGRRRSIGQLGPNLLNRRPVTTMEDVHDLAFATGEMGAGLFGHGGTANYFATREYIRHAPPSSRANRIKQGQQESRHPDKQPSSAPAELTGNRQTGRSATKRHNLGRPKEICDSSF